MKLKIFILVSLLSIFVTCKDNRKEHISQLVNEWQEKEIVFPQNLVFTRYATDTTDYQIPKSEYKVLIYIDSIGCTSCKLQLHKWKELIHYVDSVTNKNVPFLFFFHPKDSKEIRYLLKRDGINFPVCLDMEDQLNKQNHFPSDMTFQTFLLDKDNKVVILGNPVHNTIVRNLYLEQLTGKDHSTKKIPKTTAQALETERDFGTFDKIETKETYIEIKNTGENPLVIVDISTTCGCTVATYDKRPAKPGESLRVEIKMTPKDTGFFDEVVTIQYNSINNQPVKVKIKGNVR
ncbi:DUF1573 domain-containing protein [Parabacteroides pacaensis]|uniref:DUF1573 domain-containing protein n=1 Tax=Parabacteroides pacaensis TaxID=2086575 RepID=UPI000D11411B|nr:DUF1573 domain-containing protein [Parabacteroides pacaensis]